MVIRNMRPPTMIAPISRWKSKGNELGTARDFKRAGVSEAVIMQLAGWKTRSMFDRYNVVDEKDLALAVAKRDGNGNLTATSPAPAQPTDPLSSSPA